LVSTLPDIGSRMTSQDFASIYDAHAADVLRVASSVLGDRQLAEDVTHEVFLRLWRRPESFDPRRGDLQPFLRGMARNGAIDAWRRKASARRTRERLALDGPAATGQPPDSETRRLVNSAFDRLPASQRQVVALAYWGGMTASEIAEGSGVPLGTVKSRMRLALNRLRAELDSERDALATA
jgi:RNA polymerase sigma factor (sigma-70 family)